MTNVRSLVSELRNRIYSRRVRHNGAGFVDWGIDFAYGNGLSVADMKRNGVQFVCRYISTPGNAKNIDKAELANYQAAKIAVVVNFETDGTMPSAAWGEADAISAMAQATALGLPDAPIFFSLDMDPTAPGVISAATNYMRGVARVLPWHRRGTYGAYAWIKAYFDNGLGKYGWQTYAWSGGMWDSRAQLQQWNNSYPMGPASVDQDRTTASKYGQGWPPPQHSAPGAQNPVNGLKVTHRGFMSVTLAWDGEPNAQSYSVKVYRHNKLAKIVTSKTPGVRVRWLLPGHTTYEFRVRAHPGGSSGADAIIKATTR